MSLYCYYVKSNCGILELSIGWCISKQCFFMNLSRNDIPIYDSFDEIASCNDSLDYFQIVLDELEITEISLRKDSYLYQHLILDQSINTFNNLDRKSY